MAWGSNLNFFARSIASRSGGNMVVLGFCSPIVEIKRLIRYVAIKKKEMKMALCILERVKGGILKRSRKERRVCVWCGVSCVGEILERNGLFNVLAFTCVLRECAWKESEGERRRKKRVG